MFPQPQEQCQSSPHVDRCGGGVVQRQGTVATEVNVNSVAEP